MIPTIHLNIRSRRFGTPVITDTSFSNFIHTSYFTSSSSSSAFCSFFQQPDSLKRTSAVSAPRASPAPLYEFISPRHVPPAAIYDASPKDKTPFPFTKYIRPVICSQHKGLMGARMLKWAFGLVARAFRSTISSLLFVPKGGPALPAYSKRRRMKHRSSRRSASAPSDGKGARLPQQIVRPSNRSSIICESPTFLCGS